MNETGSNSRSSYQCIAEQVRQLDHMLQQIEFSSATDGASFKRRFARLKSDVEQADAAIEAVGSAFAIAEKFFCSSAQSSSDDRIPP